jgi:hypothetical protein
VADEPDLAADDRGADPSHGAHDLGLGVDRERLARQRDPGARVEGGLGAAGAREQVVDLPRERAGVLARQRPALDLERAALRIARQLPICILPPSSVVGDAVVGMRP